MAPLPLPLLPGGFVRVAERARLLWKTVTRMKRMVKEVAHFGAAA